MFDFSWSELAVIGVVALIFIGPKDLPKAMKTAAFWLRKARSVSREFQNTVEQMMREAELDEIKREIESAGRQAQSIIDPTTILSERAKPAELAPPVEAAAPLEPAAPPTATAPSAPAWSANSSEHAPSEPVTPAPAPAAPAHDLAGASANPHQATDAAPDSPPAKTGTG